MVYPKSYGTAIWVGLPAIGKHLKNIFENGKLSQDMTISKTKQPLRKVLWMTSSKLRKWTFIILTR